MAKRKLASSRAALEENYVSDENSTSTAAAIFLGQYVRCVNYDRIKVGMTATGQNGTLTIYQSIDGVADSKTQTFATTDGTSYTTEQILYFPYAKIGWATGGPAATTLVIFTEFAHNGSIAGAVKTPLNAGTGIAITGPDDAPTISTTTTITAGTGMQVTGSNPNFTLATTGTPTAGTGMSIGGSWPNNSFTNTAPDQTLTSAGGTSVIKAYPVLKGLTAGTGVSITSNTNDLQIANTDPGSALNLTAGANISITGAYPNITISYVP
jgi:hypothetical protein